MVPITTILDKRLDESDVWAAQAQFSFTDAELRAALKLVCRRTQWSEETPSAYVMSWAREIAQLVADEKKEAIMDAWKLAADQIKSASRQVWPPTVKEIIAEMYRRFGNHLSAQAIDEFARDIGSEPKRK